MKSDSSKEPVSRPALWLGIVAFAYFGCARISNDLTATPNSPLTFWLPSGLFLGVLLIAERRHWLPLVLAAGVGDFCYNYYSENSWPLPYLLLAHLGNSLAAVVGAWLVRRWVAERPALSSLRELGGLVVWGGLVSLPLSATVGALLINYSGSPASYWSNWTSWYCSDFLGVLLLTPALLAWRTATFRPAVWRFAARELEALALLISLLAATSLAYCFSWPQQTEALYVAFPFVIWAALRFGQQGATGVILITALLAAWFTAHGFGLIGSSSMTRVQKIWEILFSRGVFVFVGLLPAIALAAQRRAEASLRKINRAYHVLSEGNQALVRVDNEPQLLRTICQVLTEQGGYRLAWVGYAETDEARSIRPVAHAGFEAGYLEGLQLTWADTARGRGPAGTAIRTGRPSVAQDILRDPRFAPWRADALQRGFAAAVGLPLTGQGRTFGVLCVYAAEAQAFDEQELHMLEELAGDLAFGITTLRLRVERQQAEQRLQLQGAALQAAANAIVITDRDGTIEWVNPAFATLTGFTAAEAIGHNPRDLVKSDQHSNAFYKSLWDTILAGHVWQGEIINRRKDGSYYTEFQTITPVRNERGEITHFIGIKEDVTARKAAAARLHEQAEIIDQAPVAIVITDLAHRVTYCNKGAQHLYGLTETQLLGHTADELFSPETLQTLDEGRRATLATGSWRGEVPGVTPDGRHLVAEFIMSLICDEAGQPIARLSIALDVTEKRQMGEQVKRMQRLESLGMLAAGIAHDMNNILAPIVMAVPLLKPRVSDARGQSILATMEKSGERGAALVRQLLSFAHGASGESRLLQLRHVLKDIAEMVEASFPKSLRLATDLPGALWPVTGSASQLHQVFLNLCINARDAMPGGGTLHLEAANRRLSEEEARAIPDARPGAFLAVTVADTGTGIPPEILARIWDPFFTTKTPDKGTGLGLSTVRGIVAQHQGFIGLQTHVGRGTAFTVYLPADEAAVRGEDRPVSAAPLPRGDGELVLVVDDEPPVREMTTHILTHYGYRVLGAGDGAEALALFATHAQEVRLVVTDLQMPLLDGKNLVTALLRLRSGLPVICMSGADTVSKSLTPFISAFLVKPFTVEALVETVQAALHPPAGGAATSP